MAAMFFALMVAFVMKHVAGMRASPQTASMLEREVTWWGKDPCAQFGAKKKWWRSNICQCPKERPVPRKCDGGSGRSFDLKKTIKKGSDCHCDQDPCEEYGAKRDEDEPDTDWCDCPKIWSTTECGSGGIFRLSDASPGCRCLSEVEATERLKMPVSASALRFCDALVEQSYRGHRFEERRDRMTSAMRDALEKTSPETCQHALTGTITPREAKKAPFAAKASELSQHGQDADRNRDRRYGRMRAVKEDDTSPAEKALWEHALSQVCKDECDDLLKMMKKETKDLIDDVILYPVPFAQACAERVVQQVEAEVLGCCGRSCGFDGRRCLLWPFFSPQEKVEWEVECCSEMNVLKDSSRELMCNSVLPDRLAKEASQYDLEEQNGTDVGKVLIGQNSSLLWTKRGAQESALGKAAKAHGGEKVNMDFLIKHKKVGEEYLRLGYFRKQPLSQILNEATSIMQVHSQGTCDFGEFKEKCPNHFVTNYLKTCQDSWMVAEEEEEGEDFEEQLKDFRCSLNSPQYVAAPEECDKLAKESSILVYFTHDHNNEKKPIACVTLDKKQCVTAEEKQWWKKIQLTSVQEVMNGPEIKDYTHRVYYVRVKAGSK